MQYTNSITELAQDQLSKGVLIIPCFNEESLITDCLNRLSSFLSEKAISLDILVVNDGSTDNTGHIVRQCISNLPNLYLLELDKNSGHQAALLAGIEYSVHNNYCYSISLDADLQDDISLIPLMIDAYPKYQVVAACHCFRSSDKYFKKISASLFYGTARLLAIPVIPHHADYRLLSRRASIALLSVRHDRIFIRGTIPQLGFEVKILPYHRQVGLSASRPTSYSLSKMLSLALNGIVLNTILPLRLISLTSLAASLVSLGGICYIFISLFLGSPNVRGWTSIIVLILASASIAFLFMSVICEYILRIYRIRTNIFHYQVKQSR